jgi:hypothetical protein
MKNLYKNLIMGVFMFCSLPSAAQVFEEHALSPGGIPLIRFINSTGYPVSCYYSDEYTYLNFYILPNQFSMWFPIYGRYVWECRH